MDPLQEKLHKLSILNGQPLLTLVNAPIHSTIKSDEVINKSVCKKVATLVNELEANNSDQTGYFNLANNPKKVGPVVPPKPPKKINYPEVPQSSLVKQACEPLYSQRLHCLENMPSYSSGKTKVNTFWTERPPILQRKQSIYTAQNSFGGNRSKVTLDNPAILEQQLEALAHHKKQLERKGLLQQPEEQSKVFAKISCVPKLSSTSLISDPRSSDYSLNAVYTNVHNTKKTQQNTAIAAVDNSKVEKVYSNIYCNTIEQNKNFETKPLAKQEVILNTCPKKNVYSNIPYKNDVDDNLPSPTPAVSSVAIVDTNEYISSVNDPDEDIQPPPSPVSSSYSELRRATEVFSENRGSITDHVQKSISNYAENRETIEKPEIGGNRQTYMNMNYHNEYTSYSPTLQSISQDSSDYYGYGSSSQSSSTYESIYEPINPRPPSQLSLRSKYLMYVPYANESQIPENAGCILSNGSDTNISTLGVINSSGSNTPLYPSISESNSTKVVSDTINRNSQKEAEVEALTDFLVHSMDNVTDIDSYGICYRCNERVLGENSGCTAMDQIYHISCFTCSQCQINLQGKPFYALEGKPFCEYDYLQTLEKCSVCMKPILERILRATGKPYHPQCFTCIVCGNSLDGIPFTVDATNQNYCIADFHKKFAPRCCVCKEPIMPEPGEEETVRVVALDRSFHFECYKCEDCGLLLSSEAEGRGCYPLDDHVLCKSCNAERVQMLTNRMTTGI